MLTDTQVTFRDLTARFGELAAWHYLAEIEKAAGIAPRHGLADPEARLAYACDLQDAHARDRLIATAA